MGEHPSNPLIAFASANLVLYLCSHIYIYQFIHISICLWSFILIFKCCAAAEKMRGCERKQRGLDVGLAALPRKTNRKF